MKRFSIIVIAGFIFSNLYSQGYYVDGLRFSNVKYGSTARSLAMGGANCALGGDLGSISVNPASIGVYRSSEFTFSPSFNLLNTSSSYLTKEKTSVNKTMMNLGNLGAVFAYDNGGNEGLVSAGFALGYNKVADFNNSYSIYGNTNSTTLGNEFVKYADGYHPDFMDSYREQIAWDIGIIKNIGNNNQYYSLYDSAQRFLSGSIAQNHDYDRKGSLGEYYLGFGLNFSHNLYFGVTFNIQSGHSYEDFTHTETDINNVTDLNSYTYYHKLSTYARGGNMKFGAIYRPVEFIRLGFSVQTPTFMEVTQELDTRIDAYFTTYENHFYPVDANGDDLGPATEVFKFSTPWRINTGIGVMLGQYGIISADYELVDYSAIHFDEGDYPDLLNSANRYMDKNYNFTQNIRLGAEARLNSLYLRGGYAYYGNPGSGIDPEILYSGGIGFKGKGFFIDFAYSMLQKSEEYFMYDDTALSAAKLNTSNGSIIATLGFKF